MKSVPYILIAVMAVVIFLLYTRMRKLDRENTQKESIIAEKNDSIHYYKNDRGQLIAEKLAAEASAKEIAAAYPALVKELKEEFDIKMKDLKSYVKNTIAAQGSGNAEVHNHYTIDSTGRKYPVWQLKASDGYLDFRATVLDSLHAPFEYSYIDTLTTVVSTKKNWIFGKERLVASTTLKNPNAKVTASTSILINNYKDKRFSVGVGMGYAPFENKVFPVVYAGFNIFKF